MFRVVGAFVGLADVSAEVEHSLHDLACAAPMRSPYPEQRLNLRGQHHWHDAGLKYTTQEYDVQVLRLIVTPA
jgi:hypothetical protein